MGWARRCFLSKQPGALLRRGQPWTTQRPGAAKVKGRKQGLESKGPRKPQEGKAPGQVPRNLLGGGRANKCHKLVCQRHLVDILGTVVYESLGVRLSQFFKKMNRSGKFILLNAIIETQKDKRAFFFSYKDPNSPPFYHHMRVCMRTVCMCVYICA